MLPTANDPNIYFFIRSDNEHIRAENSGAYFEAAWIIKFP